MQEIYLDHSATTPIRPEVLEAMLPFLREHHGNAGSLHRFGRDCRRAVETAREQVAARFDDISDRSDEIVPEMGAAQGMIELGKLQTAMKG